MSVYITYAGGVGSWSIILGVLLIVEAGLDEGGEERPEDPPEDRPAPSEGPAPSGGSKGFSL